MHKTFVKIIFFISVLFTCFFIKSTVFGATIDVTLTDTINLAAEADSTTASVSDAVITNNSDSIDINITGMQATDNNSRGYSLISYDTDFSSLEIDAKKYALSYNSEDISSKLEMNDKIGHLAEKTYSFNGKISLSSEDISEKSGELVFDIKPAAFTVTFVPRFNLEQFTQQVFPEETAAKPADPVLGEASFAEWCTDSALTEPYDFSQPVRGNLTLYARYEPSIKYAVSLYGIGINRIAVPESTKRAGLTFGPATGFDTVADYKSHDPSGTTPLGNPRRCIHNDDWETIINYNNSDPYVYEQCITEGCTHSVYLSANATTTILNPNYVNFGNGDGAGILCDEITPIPGKYENLLWHIDTNDGGWGSTRIRAMLNGADSLTDITEHDSVYLENISASIYSDTNCLIACFPSELRDAIGKTAVNYDSVYDSLTPDNLKITYDKLWLLSPGEIWGTQHLLEGPQFPYWANRTESAKAYYIYGRNGGSSGIAGYWWLRSTGTSAATAMCIFNSGVLSSYSSSYRHGISPCFSLKSDYDFSQAYAFLQDDGDFVFLKSDYDITEDGYQTITDIEGNSYTGYVYSGIDNLAVNAIPWADSKSDIKNVYVSGTQAIQLGTSMCNWFSGCSNLETFDGTGLDTSCVSNMENLFSSCANAVSINVSSFDTSSVNNMYRMFTGCQKVTELNVENFDTSKVLNMAEMFAGCSSVQELDLASFDTSNVKKMQYMFNNCQNAANIDVHTFNTENVNDMGYMFAGCGSAQALDISSFNTSKVTNMLCMFDGCGTLKQINIDKAKFITSNVKTMQNMFNLCYSLAAVDVSGFDTSKVANMSRMFCECQSLDTIDVRGFDTSKVTTMFCMFDGCYAVQTLDTSNFETSKVTTMQNMFNNCLELTFVDTSGFNTSNVTNMALMFNSCEKLPAIDVSGFDTSNVASMLQMFCGCHAAGTLDVSNFDTSSVTDMGMMFNECHNLQALDVSSFSTSKVTNMERMFNGCYLIPSLNLLNFDTSNVTAMQQMFYDCRNLETLSLDDSFDTGKATSLQAMFANCYKLANLDLSGFNTGNATDMSRMFHHCYVLGNLDLSAFDASKVTTMEQMFDDCRSMTDIDLSGFDTPNLANMRLMLSSCNNLETVSLGSLDTSKVTNMEEIFSRDFKITEIDLSGWDTSGVTNMAGMFSDCPLLETIYVGNKWDTSNVVSSVGMFAGDWNIMGEQGTTYDENHTAVEYAHIDKGASNPGYLSVNGDIPVIYALSTNTWIADAGETLNDAVYTFTLTDGTTISTDDDNYSASDITNAGTVESYAVSGDNSTPRFYMIDTSLVQSNVSWGDYGTLVGIDIWSAADQHDAIGSGKTNSEIMLGRNSTGTNNGTAWTYINTLNNANTYSDWFMGSRKEYELFGYPSQAILPYSNNYFWTSVEGDANVAANWNLGTKTWDYATKSGDTLAIIPMRAF